MTWAIKETKKKPQLELVPAKEDPTCGGLVPLSPAGEMSYGDYASSTDVCYDKAACLEFLEEKSKLYRSEPVCKLFPPTATTPPLRMSATSEDLSDMRNEIRELRKDIAELREVLTMSHMSKYPHIRPIYTGHVGWDVAGKWIPDELGKLRKP